MALAKEANQKNPLGIYVAATGSALPAQRVFNDDLAAHIDTSDEWIQQRVGIKSRYIASDDESTVSLAHQASLRALESARLDPQEIDLILFATVTPDQALPCAAALLQQRLGAQGQTLSFDVRAACSGFLVALTTANGLMQSCGYRNALVVGAENLSKILNWDDRATCVLFGDGAGAVVLQSPESRCQPSCIEASQFQTYAQHSGLIQRPGGAFPESTIPPNLLPPSEAFAAQLSAYVEMDGKEVFRTAVIAMEASIREVLAQAGRSIGDVDCFIPHQSNSRMIEMLCQRVGIDADRVVSNIERVGNTSAASIPLALDEAVRQGRIRQGDLLLLTAVGAGITCGSVLLRWGQL